MPPTKTLSTKIAYQNPWITIHEDSVEFIDGSTGMYGYLEKADGNYIIALDHENYIYLIEEYRYPIRKNIIQLPAGAIDDTKDIIGQAQKELFQETGITAKTWQHLGGFYAGSGHETIYLHAYLATELDLSDLKISHQDSDEAILKIHQVSIPQIKQMILNGQIECGQTLAALNLFFLSQT